MKRILTSFLSVALFVFPVLAQDILTAVKNGDLERVKMLLEQNPENIRAKDPWQNSLLAVALLEKDFAIAKLLIESGIDVNYARADIGGNEIFNAVQSGSLEITKLIYEKGVDIHTSNRWGNTPLDGAIFGGFKEIADFLLDKGAFLNIKGKGVASLLRASLTGGLDRVTNMLIKENEVDFKDVSDLGDTFLHAAARGGETTFVGPLVEKGLDPNGRNVYGWTPLHEAASRGRRAMVEALVKNGADKNARTRDGKTPYNIADELGLTDVLLHLREKGFDPAPPRFPKLEGKYIDPDLPGTEPKMFAPGIVSQGPHFEHAIFSFAEDMKTACWADWQREGVSKVFVMENKDGLWQAPQTVQLQATNPFLAPDGNRIYFTAPRVLPDGKEARDSDVYYIERTAAGWGSRVNLGPNVNTDSDEIQPTATRDGTVYFSHNADIYRARQVDGRYAPKERLPSPVNSDDNQSHPNISPDERFMFFRSMGPRGFREPNYFFVSRNADGTWSDPVSLDKKIARVGLFARLTPDGKYWIFFEGGDYFWFDVGAVMAELLSSVRQ
ncbi:MAG: ankyrin repeat domain-containing protein [Candidatus Aminicenantes bacterium]|nr:ankyrin repeat domain-containing protein [Candidatus Aminicenantes bacterium]